MQALRWAKGPAPIRTGCGTQGRHDTLFIAGDGAQRIYPGGFTLAKAGIAVRGRSTVLRTNYRNASEIIQAAMSCAGRELVGDTGEGERFRRNEAEARAIRGGGTRPRLVRASDFQRRIEWIGDKISEMCADGANPTISSSTSSIVTKPATPPYSSMTTAMWLPVVLRSPHVP